MRIVIWLEGVARVELEVDAPTWVTPRARAPPPARGASTESEPRTLARPSARR